MAAWVVRAGSRGESEDWNLSRAEATIGWGDTPDLKPCRERAEVAALVEREWPGSTPAFRGAVTGQLWAFAHVIAPGDIVVMPMKTEMGMVAVGRCTGAYRFDASAPYEARHSIPVTWRDERVPRVSFGDDLLPSLNGMMTVYGLRKNEAETRLLHLYETGIDPGPSLGDPSAASPASPGASPPDPADTSVIDPEAAPTIRAIRDRVIAHVAERFAEHKLTHLVAEILEALGYTCEVSPPGPDGGVDIFAGSGALGLEAPTVVVEVKSERTPVGSQVVRGLHGAVMRYQADHGLLVALGGITRPARQEFASQRTRIRVWDADDLLDHIFETYDLLPAMTRQRLPLTRVLVLDDE